MGHFDLLSPVSPGSEDIRARAEYIVVEGLQGLQQAVSGGNAGYHKHIDTHLEQCLNKCSRGLLLKVDDEETAHAAAGCPMPLSHHFLGSLSCTFLSPFYQMKQRQLFLLFKLKRT